MTYRPKIRKYFMSKHKTLMSCLHIHMPKKLHKLSSFSKKAWRSFTSSLHPKLHDLRRHLKFPKSVTTTARRLLLRQNPKRNPFTPRDKSRISYSYYHQYYNKYQHIQQSTTSSPATVYVDRMYGESSKAETSRSSGGNNNDNINGSENDGSHVKWKEYVASLPRIQGVDERAEEFISKFRQEMQLQREQSILDFQQMLARSM